MARRSKQLDADIAATLAQGSGHASATVRDWQNLKDGIWARLQANRVGVVGPRARAEREILTVEYSSAHQGLRAARQAERVAKKARPTNVTSQNLSVLKDLVVKHGSGEFPKGYSAGHPHIKRCIAGGLVELIDANNNVTGEIFKGKRLRLTPTGREMVADLIISDIETLTTDRDERLSRGQPPIDIIFVPGMTENERAKVMAEKITKRDAKIQRLEDTLANLRR